MITSFENTNVDFSLKAGETQSVIFGEGWSKREVPGRWAVGSKSIVILPPACHEGPYRLQVQAWPMLVEGDVPQQRIELILNGTALGTRSLTKQDVSKLAFDIPAEAVNKDGPNIFVINNHDACSPKPTNGNTDSRLLSLLHQHWKVELPNSSQPLHQKFKARTLFIVTGVCLPGRLPNIELITFLHSHECDILIWLDFIDPNDYQNTLLVLQGLPNVHLSFAPRALWGGPSIVQSMLRALSYAIDKIGGWTQAVFTSVLDVPLLQKQRLLDELESLSLVDFCSSKWTNDSLEYIFKERFVVDSGINSPKYTFYSYRADTHLRVDTDLSEICPKECVENARITRDLPERYCLGVSENLCSSTLTLRKLSQGRSEERAEFFSRLGFAAGRMWIFCSRRFARTLVSDEVSDLFHSGFRDVLIADECFFQSVAQNYARLNRISVLWKSLQFDNANPCIIDESWFRTIIMRAKPGELFARKSYHLRNYAALLEESESLRLPAEPGSGTELSNALG